MSRLCSLLSFPLLGLVTGCGGEPSSVPPVIDSVAYAQKSSDGTYEVQLRYSITSSGGPCFSKDWFKTWTSYSTNWLYVKTLEGVQDPAQIVLKAGVKDQSGDYTYAIKDLRGTVSFSNSTLEVQLEQPHVLQSGAVQGYVPYYLNGTYQILLR